MENKNTEKGKVCVTGGNGYVGSWLVMRLLQHGYYVNTTVRSNTGLFHFQFLDFFSLPRTI